MTRSVLWAPWRGEYVGAPRPDGCVFCRAAEGTDDRENLVLLRGEGAFLILNRFPYTVGHLMAVPDRHVGAMEDLSEAEARELWALAVRAKQALDAVLRPHGYNVGLNLGPAAGAGVADHLHLHVVPRWVGDSNFLPVLGEVRVISQHLLQTYDSLVSELCRQGGGGEPGASGER